MTLAPTPAPGGAQRPKYRPPIGIPNTRQNSTGSAIASVLLHALIIFLLLGPIIARDLIATDDEGAGGKGPAGGGGGGGYKQERATYVEVAPPPPAVKTTTQPQIVPPPVVKPPEPQIQPLQTLQAVPMATSSLPVTTVGSGAGGDGSGGAGPGTGGGVGSGNGTGRGSADGPGTGGGNAKVYPPTVTHLAMLPLPVPRGVRPYTLVAIFEVDETGKARLLQFNETKDRDYNKKIRAMLDEIRFRPAVRADGTPVRDTTSITAEAKL